MRDPYSDHWVLTWFDALPRAQQDELCSFLFDEKPSAALIAKVLGWSEVDVLSRLYTLSRLKDRPRNPP